EHYKEDGEISALVNLLHVPNAGDDGDDQSCEVEKREVQRGVPREGVTDLAIERVRLVFVEADDVGPVLAAGKLREISRDEHARQHHAEPQAVEPREAMREERERERPRRQEKYPDPDRQVA